MKFIKTLLCSLVAIASAQDDSEPSYKIMESHSMESPITKKEFDFWQTYGTSVF